MKIAKRDVELVANDAGLSRAKSGVGAWLQVQRELIGLELDYNLGVAEAVYDHAVSGVSCTTKGASSVQNTFRVPGRSSRDTRCGPA